MSGGGKSLPAAGGCVDVGVLVDVDKDAVVIGVGPGPDLVMSGNWKPRRPSRASLALGRRMPPLLLDLSSAAG